MRVRLALMVSVAASLALSACREQRHPAPAEAPVASPGSVRSDSLALRAPDGSEVWLVGGRAGTAAGGATCDERLIEVRRDGHRIPVPLLYSGGAPVLVDDSTIEAVLWLHCAPGDTYRVNLHTGQPVKHRAAGAA